MVAHLGTIKKWIRNEGIELCGLRYNSSNHFSCYRDGVFMCDSVCASFVKLVAANSQKME